MERSSLESIHQLLRVSTKRVSIGATTIVLARNFIKSARKSLDGRSHSSVVASSTHLNLSVLDVYGQASKTQGKTPSAKTPQPRKVQVLTKVMNLINVVTRHLNLFPSPVSNALLLPKPTIYLKKISKRENLIGKLVSQKTDSAQRFAFPFCQLIYFLRLYPMIATS